jgi:hypothetical protein
MGDHQRRQVFGRLIGVVRRIGDQHAAHPGHPRGCRCGRGASAAGHQQVDIVASDFRRRGDGVERRRLERVVVVFSNDENGHGQITFASVLSLITRSAASATLTPAVRFAGSATLRIFRRGATSTPRAAGVVVSSGLRLAFMMFGSVA